MAFLGPSIAAMEERNRERRAKSQPYFLAVKYDDCAAVQIFFGQGTPNRSSYRDVTAAQAMLTPSDACWTRAKSFVACVDKFKGGEPNKACQPYLDTLVDCLNKNVR